MSRDAAGRTPVTIVTGFLGSGKTTLLNHFLTTPGVGRVAALVNDVGAVNIDAALISTVTTDVVQLTNGCICCTINGGLLEAAERVLALEPSVDRIVVETTGLADPLPVGLTFLQTDLRARTSLDAVITLVDCANFSLDLFKADAAMAQIVHADLVVLNKIDLVEQHVVEALENRIGLVKRHARTIRAERGRVPVALLLDGSDTISIEERIDPTAATPAHRAASHGAATDGFRSHALQFGETLSSSRFQNWLDHALPANVYRAKGLVRFDRRQQPYVFQLCGGRAAFEPFNGPVDDTTLVFIGRGLDTAALERDVRACLTA
jgi:G3E family GTPase